MWMVGTSPNNAWPGITSCSSDLNERDGHNELCLRQTHVPYRIVLSSDRPCSTRIRRELNFCQR